MDEGAPIAYPVLEEGVPIFASGGERIGTVEHVVAAIEQDIFHGIVMRVGHERVFVAADDVASLHERGVDLRIDAACAGTLAAPNGGAPAYRANEPGVAPSRWTHIVDIIAGRDPRGRNWKDE